jgi:ribosome-associated translation inhibitor RaiA
MANKNLTLVYQNIEPNLELKLFVSGQLTYLLEKCPNNSNLTAKIVDRKDGYLVQINLATESDLFFASGEDEVVAAALDSAISELSVQLRYANRGTTSTTYDYELF